MKALVLRGKLKGQVVKISQWCNDWFTLDTGDWRIDRQPMSPSNLLFTKEGRDEIIALKNNGIMFQLFELHANMKRTAKIEGEVYVWGFKRRKYVR